MKPVTWMVVMVVAAGCGEEHGRLIGPPLAPVGVGSDAAGDGPGDGSSDAAVDAPVDAGIDVSPSRLIELCGAVPVTFDDWEDCYQKRWCEWIVGCRVMNRYRDVQQCLDRSDAVEGGRLSAERRARARAVADGRASLDVPAFTQCLLDTDPAFCNTAQSSVACATRFTGTVGDGDSCRADVECSSPGATCPVTCTGACCTGTCHPKFKLGQTCDTFTSCEPGLRCDRICFSGDIGASCGDDGDCDPNAWCNAGRCAADFSSGADCRNPLQCGGVTSCVGLTIVGSDPGQCLPISHAGDHCDFFCYGNLFCDASRTCRDLVDLDQSCSGSAPCRGVDTMCQGGKCVLRNALGASCSAGSCLPELFCTAELNAPNPTCVARGGEGAPCAAPSHCQSFRCSGNNTEPGVCLAEDDTCRSGGN